MSLVRFTAESKTEAVNLQAAEGEGAYFFLFLRRAFLAARRIFFNLSRSTDLGGLGVRGMAAG